MSGQIYYVSVKATDGAGLTSICSSDGTMVDVSAGINENENAINISAHPNPFNENATLLFYQKNESRVTISLIDILGKEIIIANTVFSAGEHSVEINADELKLAKGVYTFRVSSDKYSTSFRLIKY